MASPLAMADGGHRSRFDAGHEADQAEFRGLGFSRVADELHSR